MTKEESKNWVLGCIYHDGFIHTKRFDVANQVIKEALEKQIPKRLKYIEFVTIKGGYEICPTCGKTVLEIHPYCGYCGQLIDRSDDK